MRLERNMDAGHVFLAKLGKKRLRPGGLEATEWLIEQAGVQSEHRVLEIACNNCSSMVDLTKRFGCEVVGVDIDPEVIAVAKARIDAEHLADKLSVERANAIDLPFTDESFDLVINEAMLTMFNADLKQKAVQEYYRVLKRGGLLLTHDICLSENVDQEKFTNLRDIIRVPVEPLTQTAWLNLFESCGFSDLKFKTGEIDFLKIKGLIRDEGGVNSLTIIKNAILKGKLKRFLQMKKFFDQNHQEFRYIVIASHKN